MMSTLKRSLPENVEKSQRKKFRKTLKPKPKKVFTGRLLREKLTAKGIHLAIRMIKEGKIKFGNRGDKDPRSPKQHKCDTLKALENCLAMGQLELEVPYYQSRYRNGTLYTLYGRESTRGLASQTMPRILRAILVGQRHYDADMVNAHFAILACWAINNVPGESFKFLMRYVTKRKEMLQEIIKLHSTADYKVTRDDAKDLFITVLYRKFTEGFYDAWLLRKVNKHTGEVERPALKEDPNFRQWANTFAKEIDFLRNKILEENPKFCERYKSDDHKGTFFNRVMTDKEHEHILVIMELLKEQGWDVNAIIHDGCHVVKQGDKKVDTQAINQKLKERWPCGLIQVKIKAFDKPEIPDEWIAEAEEKARSFTERSHFLIAKGFETKIRKQIEAHWRKEDSHATVEPPTLEKNHRLTYKINTQKGTVHSYYFIYSGRLVYAAKRNQCGFPPKSELIAPEFPKWDPEDFGSAHTDAAAIIEKTRVEIDGDTIQCYGTYLPAIRLGEHTYWDHKSGILWLKPGTYAIIAAMGRGKSYTMTQAIKNAVDAGDLAIYPTYRRSLANGLTAELRRNDVKNVVHYRDAEAKVPQFGAFTVQLESIENKVRSAKPSIIVSDEVQGLSAQFASNKTMKGGESYNAWRVLKNKYGHARYKFFMDADLDFYTPRSEKYIKHMCGKYTRIIHTGKPKQRIYIDCKDEGSLVSQLIKALLRGLKVFLVSNTAAFLEKLWPQLPKSCIARAFYGDKRLEPHMDINKIAADLDLLAISAGSIGSGVSIELKHMKALSETARGFDVCFAYGLGHDKTAPVRDWYQALSRVREVGRGLYFFSIADSNHSDINTKGLRQQRNLLFKDRRQDALQAMAHNADVQSKQLALASNVLQHQTQDAVMAGLDEDMNQQKMIELFVAKGLIPSEAFVSNLCQVEQERQNSTYHFRELFMQRAIHDGHKFYTLDPSKLPVYEKKNGCIKNPITEIIQAPGEPILSNGDWNAAEAVKIKSFACHYFPKIDSEFITWPAATSVESDSTPGDIHNICKATLNDIIAQVGTRLASDFLSGLAKCADNKNIPDIDHIVKFKSLRKRFQTLEQLEQWHQHDIRHRRVHGSATHSLNEIHICFLKALRDFWKITPDTPHCFEPDEDDAKQRIARAKELVPGLKSFGQGSEFQKVANALKKHFENNGVMTGLVTCRKRPPGKENKQQRWSVVDSHLIEYADLMDIKLDDAMLARRTNHLDCLRKVNLPDIEICEEN